MRSIIAVQPTKPQARSSMKFASAWLSGRATEWLNSPRLTTAGLLGKVVLVDFCTCQSRSSIEPSRSIAWILGVETFAFTFG